MSENTFPDEAAYNEFLQKLWELVDSYYAKLFIQTRGYSGLSRDDFGQLVLRGFMSGRISGGEGRCAHIEIKITDIKVDMELEFPYEEEAP